MRFHILPERGVIVRLSTNCSVGLSSIALCGAFLVIRIPSAFAQSVQVTITDSSISPKTIQATKGQSVHIEVVNKGMNVHNFVVPKFYVFSPNIESGGTADVRFKPDKTGVFQYYSDKKGVPEPGIQGMLHVH